MGYRLHDNLTSGYFEAANRLKSKQARRRIVVYVESYDDIFFWRTILSQLETDRIYFEIMLPSRENKLKRGKKAAMMSMLSDKVGGHMIACIDADYDYLLQGFCQALTCFTPTLTLLRTCNAMLLPCTMCA